MKRVPREELIWGNGFWHEGELFTGTAIETWPDGSPKSEQEMRVGVEHATGREWSPSGQLVATVPYRRGARHGLSHRWHASGRPALDELHQYGRLLQKTSWDDAGNVIEVFEADRSGADYRYVEQRLAEPNDGDDDDST